MLTLHDPLHTQEQYVVGAWQGDTFFSLLAKHALERPNDIALRDVSATLTWVETLTQVENIASALSALGLSQGDRVAIWLPSRVESVIIFLACSRNGYVCCPSLHQSYTADEVITLLQRISCKAFFTQPGYGSDSKTNSVFDRLDKVKTLLGAYVLGPHFGASAPEMPAALTYPHGAAR